MNIIDLLSKTIELGASDLHITVGHAPCVRFSRGIVSLNESVITSNDTLNLSKEILDDKNLNKKEVLSFQKELILEKRNRLNNIIQSIDEQINDLGGNKSMSKKDFKVFDYEKIKCTCSCIVNCLCYL